MYVSYAYEFHRYKTFNETLPWSVLMKDFFHQSRELRVWLMPSLVSLSFFCCIDVRASSVTMEFEVRIV